MCKIRMDTLQVSLQVLSFSLLLAAWLYEQTTTNERWKDIKDTSKLVLLLTCIQCIVTLITRGRLVSRQVTYVGWLLTTPLLLRMVYLYAITKLNLEDRQRVEKTFFLILVDDSLMIVLIYLAEYVYVEMRMLLLFVSFLLLFVVVGWIFYFRNRMQIILSCREWNIFPLCIGWQWLIHVFGIYFDDITGGNMFSVLDILNKAFFCLVFSYLLEVTDRQNLLPST